MMSTSSEHLNIADWLLDARVREGRGDRPAVLTDTGAVTYRDVQALANAHLDPEHLSALNQVVKIGREAGYLPIVFPDLTRKPWATRLGDEFRSGACHAGQFETSIVLQERPGSVRELRHALPANPKSLSDAIYEGKRTFEEAGGPRAYFGSPAAATADEGRRTIDVLGAILEEAVLAELKA